MVDLDRVFGTLDRLDTPVTWPDVELREPRPLPPGPGPARRLLTVAVALVVAAAGIGFAVAALTSDRNSSPAASGNGLIAFEVSRPNDRATEHSISTLDPAGGVVADLLVGEAEAFDYAHPAWSPSGSVLAFVRIDHFEDASRWSIWVAGADGSDPRELYREEPSGPAGNGESSIAIEQIAWSPDASRIAFVRVDRASGFGAEWIQRLYVMDAVGGAVTALTDASFQVQSFSWSPDSTAIVLSGTPFGGGVADLRLYAMNADGTGMTDLGLEGTYPAWSPDGTRIAFAAHEPYEENSEIFAVNADGTGLTQLTDTPEADWRPVWSPDGGRIAFLQEDAPVWERCRLAVMAADGSAQRTLLEGSALGGCLFNPAWQPVPVDEPTPPEPTPSITEILPIDPHVTATIPVGAFLNGVAVGEGAVWASVDNANGGPDDHLLVRIDPTTNEIVDSLPLPEAGDLAVGDGAVWVLSWVAREGAVLRIDPSTNEIVTTIPVGEGLSNVAVGEGAVWVTRSNDANPPSGEVVRIDPVTNEIVARIPVSGGWPRDLVIGEGSVWAYGHSRLAEHSWEASSLWQIDPVTNEVFVVVDQEGFLGDGSALPDNVAVGDGYVWAAVADEQGRGLRIDPATGQVIRFDVSGGFAWPFLVEAGRVWFGRDEIRLLDTETLEVVDVIDGQIENVDAAFDPSTAALWVANYDGTITRIDLG